MWITNPNPPNQRPALAILQDTFPEIFRSYLILLTRILKLTVSQEFVRLFQGPYSSATAFPKHPYPGLHRRDQITSSSSTTSDFTLLCRLALLLFPRASVAGASQVDPNGLVAPHRNHQCQTDGRAHEVSSGRSFPYGILRIFFT